MNYLAFLTWAVANIGTVKLLLVKVQEIFEILKGLNLGGLLPAAEPGTLGMTLEMELSDEEKALETQTLALLVPDVAGEPLAVRDGTKLRELFALIKTYGPLILQYAPALLALLPK